MAELVKIRMRVTTDQREAIQFIDYQDGTRGGLKTRWSAWSRCWYLWLLAVDGEQIAGPIAVVPGIDLLVGRKHDPRVPQGQLFVYSKDRLPPDLDTVDVESILFYRRVQDVT